MIDGAKARRVMADKEYTGRADRSALRGRHRDGIMRKAARDRPLRSSEERFDRLISKRRFRIGPCFGLAMTQARPAMAAIGQNLLEAANRISRNPPTPAIA